MSIKFGIDSSSDFSFFRADKHRPTHTQTDTDDTDHSTYPSAIAGVSNKKHLKNVGPIRHCEPPLHCHSPGVATVARQL